MTYLRRVTSVWPVPGDLCITCDFVTAVQVERNEDHADITSPLSPACLGQLTCVNC